MKEILIASLFFISFFSIPVIFLIEENKHNTVRKAAAILAGLTLIICLYLQFYIDFNADNFSFYRNFVLSEYYNITYSLAIDGISYVLILLSILLNILCLTVIWEIKYKLKDFIICLFIIQFLLINVFCTIDLIFFYIFFEAILIPMFLMIGLWGARERKIDASYKFFLYTFLGSIFMLTGILYILTSCGTTNLFHLLAFNYLQEVQELLWIGFFISFAVKVPMWPVHLWLPEAHTEAPTAGSVLLAGILLKLGTYGMVRFLLPLYPHGSSYFKLAVYCISVVAIIYTSLTALRQIDLKKAIAYSSVAHMNLVTIGLFTITVNGCKGATFLMISHGVVSSALFMLIGVIYDRYHTRNIKYYGGIALVMPIFASMFLIQILSNMGFPGTSGFIGEFIILLLAYSSNTLVCIIATTGVILSAAYSVWLYNRIAFGPLKTLYIKNYSDTNEREFSYLVILCIFTLILGIYPNVILNIIDHPIIRIVL